MLVSRITSTLVLAVAAATAFDPLPSKQSPLSDEALKTLDNWVGTHAKDRGAFLVVACPSCEPPAPGCGNEWTFDDETSDPLPGLANGEQGLRFDFSISEDGRELVLNDRVIFPCKRRSGRFSFYQVSKLAHNSFVETLVTLTSYSIGHHNELSSSSETRDTMFVGTIAVLKINRLEPFRDVTVDIRFQQKKDGQVRIVEVEPVEPQGYRAPMPAIVLGVVACTLCLLASLVYGALWSAWDGRRQSGITDSLRDIKTESANEERGVAAAVRG